MDKQIRREARLKKKQETKRKRAVQETSEDLPTSEAALPPFTSTPAEEGESINAPLEEGVEEVLLMLHSTPKA